MHRKKIDKSGKFITYPGVTVIYPLKTDISTFYNKFNEMINTNRNPYTVLPLDSMHTTMIGLWSEYVIGSEEYAKVVSMNMDTLMRMQKKLRTSGTNVNMKVIYSYGHGLKLEPYIDHDDCESLAHNESIVMSEMPSINISMKNKYYHHMTLAYRYANNNPIHDVDVDRLCAAYLPRYLSFSSPLVCKFDDMTAYQPI